MAMKQEDKYPTLEQSKRIVELLGGSAPESQMVWLHTLNDVEGNPVANLLPYSEHNISWLNCNVYCAYDLAELGAMPQFKLEHLSMIKKQPNKMWRWAKTNDAGTGYYIMEYPTEVQARAALLIHLLETNKENNQCST